MTLSPEMTAEAALAKLEGRRPQMTGGGIPFVSLTPPVKAKPQTAYEYRASVVRWIDGDTVELEVDLGFRLTFQDHFRLDGIDTPERGRVGAVMAKMRAEQLAPYGTEILIKTTKADKYGRYLASLWPDVGPSINSTLIEEGLAKPYFGGKKE